MGSPQPDPQEPARNGRRIKLAGRSLREHATRGLIITAIWMAGLVLIQFIRGIELARIVGSAEFGTWGAVLTTQALLASLRMIGTNELFVGQEEDDQARAFGKVFAVELTLNGFMMLVTVVIAPLVALAYGDVQVLWPILAVALLWPAQTLQAPLWELNRQMAFAKLRITQALDPVVGTIVALVLALAGFGAWSLVIGLLAGAWVTAIAAFFLRPYPLKPVFEKVSLRHYGRLAGPLWVSAVAGSLVPFGLMIVANGHLSRDAVGTVSFAASLVFMAQRLDDVVSNVMYPTIAAAQDKPEVLREAFNKANRAGLAWAIPVSVGLVLFAPAVVPLILQDKGWVDAPLVVQWFAVSMAITHLGTNWWQYELLAENPKPLAYNALMALAIFFLIQIPMIYAWGIEGLAASMVPQAVAQVALRTIYVRRRFGSWSPLKLGLRSLMPTVPAALVAVGLDQVGAAVGISVGAFALLVTVGTVLTERDLVIELSKYFRGALTRKSSSEALNTPLVGLSP